MIIIDGIIYSDEIIKKEIVKQATNNYDYQDSLNNGQTQINETTELGDSLKQLNNDDIEKGFRMSGIDMRTRLQSSEIPPLLAIDYLVGCKVLPIGVLSLTRQKKRIAVSIQGLGRREIVDIVAGKQDRDKAIGSSMIDRVKSWLPGTKKEIG